MLINKVSDDACHVVISIGGIFFYRTLCMLHDEEKLSIQGPCSSDFPALHETFVRSKYANSVSQFLLYL